MRLISRVKFYGSQGDTSTIVQLESFRGCHAGAGAAEERLSGLERERETGEEKGSKRQLMRGSTDEQIRGKID